MRSARSKHLGRFLAALSDDEITALLIDGEPLATGIGGSTARIRVEGTPVFVKQMPVTAWEKADIDSTANLFGLPTACHYGIGSPGFGAGRERAVHELTSRWVRDGETDIFPLLHHSRVLEQRCRTDTSEFEGSVPQRQWGAGWPSVKRRVDSLREADSSAVLFLEYLPETLETWLRAQFTGDADTSGAAFAAALHQIIAGSAWMRAHGVQHLDVHPQNILVHQGRLLFTDFGLSVHQSFDLDQDERAFFALHGDYDHDVGVTSLLHWALAELGASSRAQRLMLMRSAAADGRTEILERICAPLDGAADLVVDHATTAAAITEMFDLLMTDASATSYGHRGAG